MSVSNYTLLLKSTCKLQCLSHFSQVENLVWQDEISHLEMGKPLDFISVKMNYEQLACEANR